MSEFYEYLYKDPPKDCERLLWHVRNFKHGNTPIRIDICDYQYLSQRVRYCMRANDVADVFELSNFIRYEYRAGLNARWRTIFEAHSFFSHRALEIIKIYIYGFFNENDQFVHDKLKVLQGQEIANLENVIVKHRLLPKNT